MITSEFNRIERDRHFWDGSTMLVGTLRLPRGARGVVILAFASASRSDRKSTHSLETAFNAADLGTFSVDLLTADEDQIDSRTEHYRLDIAFLARRIIAATRWVKLRTEIVDLPIGYFVTGTTAAAAFLAAKKLGSVVQAIVSYAGAPDFASPLLPQVRIPGLFLVDEDDVLLINRNREAYRALNAPKELVLLDEQNQLSVAATLASDWFLRHFHRSGEDRQLFIRSDAESDAKGAVESQVQRAGYVVGEESLGYTGAAHEEHTGEPVVAVPGTTLR